MYYKQKIQKLKQNSKAMSPVVASIILIAVTVAVSVAVAAWMGGLAGGFMQTEQITITNVQFASTTESQTVTVTVKNTGSNDVVISSATVTPAITGATATPAASYGTGFSATTTGTLPANAEGTITITTTDPDGLYAAGGSYKVTLLTSKGTSFSYNAVAT
jgi:flagellin-like protein